MRVALGGHKTTISVPTCQNLHIEALSGFRTVQIVSLPQYYLKAISLGKLLGMEKAKGRHILRIGKRVMSLQLSRSNSQVKLLVISFQ